MEYQWDSSLETGYEKVDRQHKQLISAVNNLMKARRSGKGDEAVMETLDFLTGYAVKHFSDEENLQIKYNYPDYLNHKRIHGDFRKTVEGLVEQIRVEGPTEELIGMVCFTAGSWLLNHIKGDDFRMAAFVKAAQAKTSE